MSAKTTPGVHFGGKTERISMSSSIAAMHVAKKQLGLDDDTYRAKLRTITGKSSAKDMTEAERQQVLTVFRNDGFAPRPTQRKDRASGKYAPKLQSLWIAAWNLGIVRDKRDVAMIAFVKRQTGLDHTRFLTDAFDATRAIEALKSWMRRETNNDDLFRTSKWVTPAENDPRMQIVLAQWDIALAEGIVDGCLRDWIAGMGLKPGFPALLSSAQWIAIMDALGERIRDAKGGA